MKFGINNLVFTIPSLYIRIIRMCNLIFYLFTTASLHFINMLINMVINLRYSFRQEHKKTPAIIFAIIRMAGV